MRIGSLFSGYGGLDMAVQSVLGGELAWHVEYDKAPSAILNHHHPDVPNHGDVTTLDFTTVEPVDVLTGGYPCQPFSHAGMRKGTDDERHLWPHVLRALRDMGPRLAILENVRGHLTLGFDVVLADLARIGWSAEWVIVRASDAGAPHQRARLFIAAYPGSGSFPWASSTGERLRLAAECGDWAADATGNGRDQWRPQSAGIVGRHDAAQRGDASAYPDDAGLQGSQPARGRDLPTRGAPADASHDQWQEHQSHDSIVGQWAALRRGTVIPAGAGGNGSDHVGDVAGTHAPARQASSRNADASADADVAGSQARRVEPRRAGGQPTAGPGQPVGGYAAHGGDSPPPDTVRSRRHGRSSASVGGQVGGTATTGRGETNWGGYGPAIARWEPIIGRPAPRPTEPGRTGQPRLSPRFVEWMMGLPDGHVTDPAIGISRNDQLKALGNGVVPQQAALALDVLFQRTAQDVA
jgi:DNA (cytosine-5)-methyltransferase 1